MGKLCVVVYKFMFGLFNYMVYCILDKKFYNFFDIFGKGSFDYLLLVIVRFSLFFNFVRFNLVLGKVSFYNGIDYFMFMNMKIVSVIDGKIIWVEYNSIMGYFVEVMGKVGVKICYFYFNKIFVIKGVRVIWGDVIVLFGNSGCLFGFYLYYELVINNNFVNLLVFWVVVFVDNKFE